MLLGSLRFFCFPVTIPQLSQYLYKHAEITVRYELSVDMGDIFQRQLANDTGEEIEGDETHQLYNEEHDRKNISEGISICSRLIEAVIAMPFVP